MAKSGKHGHLVRWHASLINEHRAWLARFNEPERVKVWDDLLARVPEAALSEALVRRLLHENVYMVMPQENLAEGGPDFRCLQMTRHFCVDTVCLPIDVVTEATGLMHLSRGESGVAPLTDRLLEECRQHAEACRGVDDAPCLLAVATLHRAASEMFLHDRTTVEGLLTASTTGEEVFGGPAKECVSGLLLCGFGLEPATVHGVLNPDAARPFERRLLPEIPFCRLVEQGRGERVSLEWL
ncbi:MAG TPA: hypothetical protein VMZ92_07465 [Planctomycetota bacterium]|nr:hypothetical protein [Planctomycetota bacterium]